MKRLLIASVLLAAFSVIAKAADAPFSMLRWEDVTDHGKNDSARAVAISGSTAIAAELLTTADDGLDFTVKAFDITTGQLKWENSVQASPFIVTEVYLATSGDSVFALGYIPGAGGPYASSDIFLRAYRVSTGNVLWTHIWDAGLDDFPKGIAVAGGRVTIVGYGGDAQPGENIHGLVRTLDQTTGAVLWTSIINKTGTRDAVFGVAADGQRVVTSGITDVGTRTDLVLRSYNPQTGSVTWETQRQATSGMVRLGGNRVFVAGLDSAGGASTFLAAYDVFTGSQLWQTPATSGWFGALAVNETQVVAVGSAGIQSVHPYDGATRWFHPAPCCTGYTENLSRVALTTNAVYAAGNAGQDFTYQETLLRAYSPAGLLLGDERSHRVAGSKSSVGMALVVVGQTLVTGGSVTNATTDAVARAYDISAIEPEITVGPVNPWSAPIAFQELMWARQQR